MEPGTLSQAPHTLAQALACPSVNRIMMGSVGLLVTNHGNQLQLTSVLGSGWAWMGWSPWRPLRVHLSCQLHCPTADAVGLMSSMFQDDPWAWGPGGVSGPVQGLLESLSPGMGEELSLGPWGVSGKVTPRPGPRALWT